MRAWLLKLHLWGSLITAIPLLIVCVTGAVLVYGEEIDRALEPELHKVTPAAGAAALPLETLLDRVKAAYPRDEFMGVTPPADAGRPFMATTRTRQYIYVDPYTGAILGQRPIDYGVRRKMFLLHSELLAGEIGHLIVVISTVVCLFLTISGVILWWKFQIWGVKWRANWRRVNFDLHSVIGLYSTPVLLVLALTGVLIAYETVTYPAIARMLGDKLPGPGPKSTVPAASGPAANPAGSAAAAPAGATLDDVIAAVTRKVPEGQIMAIAMPRRTTDVYGVYVKFPEDPAAFGRSRVFVDRHSGEVLDARLTREVGWGTYITGIIEPIHFGNIWGQPTRILAFLVSLFVAGQIVTGLLIWWKKGKKASSASSASSAARTRPAA